MTPSSRHTSRKPLYGIITAFIAPIILAYALFYSGYGSNHTRSRGTLLSPPIVITQQNNPFWQIATTAETLAQNQEKFHTISKRWQALGKDQHRVKLTAFTDKEASHSINKDWKVQAITHNTIAKLQQTHSKNHHLCRIFIIDPHNNAILCYDDINELRDIDLDLRKLLKTTRI